MNNLIEFGLAVQKLKNQAIRVHGTIDDIIIRVHDLATDQSIRLIRDKIKPVCELTSGSFGTGDNRTNWQNMTYDHTGDLDKYILTGFERMKLVYRTVAKSRQPYEKMIGYITIETDSSLDMIKRFQSHLEQKK